MRKPSSANYALQYVATLSRLISSKALPYKCRLPRYFISFCAITEAQMDTSPACDLLDMPDAALRFIIAGLADSDKKMIMAACRKTFDMAMLNAEITLKVAQGSNFAGFKKVLNSTSPASIHLVIMCPAGKSKNSNALHYVPLSTVAVLMGSLPDSTLAQFATSCQGKAWERNTKVTIEGTMLRCLVPRFLALTCPQLVQLKIVRPLATAWSTIRQGSSNPDEVLPLTFCTSLKHLEISDPSPNLPASCHSPAELRQNLPNIDTLIFVESHVASLIETFATQLTHLEINGYDSNLNEVQQLVRPCSSLQHLYVPELVLPDNTTNLKVVELGRIVTEGDMQLLLQLPSLIELQLPDLYRIHQDCSHHACCWQKIHLHASLNFGKLAKLNLSNLQQLTVGPDVVICLPNPYDPSSLTVVQRIVAILSQRQIVVSQNNIQHGLKFCRYSTMQWDILDCGSEYEQNAAELIRVAAQRIGPCKLCNCQALSHRPLPLAAVLQWGQTFIESVCLGRTYDPLPSVWQALRQLDRLHTVVYWAPARQDRDTEDKGYDGEIFSAAHHYIIPASKSLRIECGFSKSRMEPAETAAMRALLRAAIQDVIPTGCKLASIEYSCMEPTELHSYYDCQRAVWVVVVEPLHLTA